MIIITRNNEYVEKDWTEAEFNATSLPAKGWSVYKGVWPIPLPEPGPVPVTEISIAQCCQYLLSIPSGNQTLLDDVEDVISGMSRTAQIDWQRRTSVKRDYPLVIQLQALFGWTDARMDEMFTAASLL